MSNSSNQRIIISDPTLRDGNHAIKHQLTLDNIRQYAIAIDQTGVDIIEVGHGNGLGASSLQVGQALCSDRDMLKIARQALKKTKLGIHIIPGFGRIDRDLQVAIDEGVDVIRVASHCTEADTTERHIKYARKNHCEVFGVLMMSHMASKETLLQESKKMQDYGAQAIILMDSAGAYLPKDINEKIGYLISNLNIPLGFHAHNNLGMAVANSVAAAQIGATILDATASGFGPGAGNVAIEVMVAVLQKLEYPVDINLYKLLDAVELAQNTFIEKIPTISTLSLTSGLAGVFSGFTLPVKKASETFDVDPREIFRLLGEKKVVAGQEDLIIETAQELQDRKNITNNH